jgi:hypothetical protein
MKSDGSSKYYFEGARLDTDRCGGAGEVLQEKSLPNSDERRSECTGRNFFIKKVYQIQTNGEVNVQVGEVKSTKFRRTEK